MTLAAARGLFVRFVEKEGMAVRGGLTLPTEATLMTVWIWLSRIQSTREGSEREAGGKAGGKSSEARR